jgi:hypothetical protein
MTARDLFSFIWEHSLQIFLEHIQSCQKKVVIPIILADFNIELKKKENESFVINMKETFGLKSCTDIVFARDVDNLKCANYITYFSYHRPILSITNST